MSQPEICNFCKTYLQNNHPANCPEELETRLITLQNGVNRLLSAVEKIGRNKIRQQFPKLLEAIDPLNISQGPNLSAKFLERFELSTAVCEKLVSNEQVDDALGAYKNHVKAHGGAALGVHSK